MLDLPPFELVRPRTRIGAKNFLMAVNAWKMYYDLDLSRGGKTGKEFVLAGSKFFILIFQIFIIANNFADRVKTTITNRPIISIEDMKEFIDLDLGHAI